MKKLVSLLCIASIAVGMSCPTALAAAIDVSPVSSSIYKPEYVSPEDFFATSPVLTNEQIESIIIHDPNAISINEFDKLMEMKQEAAQYLSDGETDTQEMSQLERIADFNPEDRVKELQAVSDDELENMGFDQKRISIIRNYTGNAEQLRSLGATVTISFSNQKYSNVGGNRWAKMTTAFSWNGVPFWGYEDCLVMGGGTSFHAQPVADTYCKIYYTANGATGSKDFPETYDKDDLVVSPFVTTNSGFHFPESIEKVSSNGTGIVYHARTGYATMAFMSTDNRQVVLSGAYGHALRKVNIDIGIDYAKENISGGVSISLSEKTYDIVAKAANPYVFAS